MRRTMLRAVGSVSSNLAAAKFQEITTNKPKLSTFVLPCARPVVGDDLPEHVEDGDVEEVEYEGGAAVLLPEVVAHPVRLLHQHALQTFLAEPKIFQGFQSKTSLRFPSFSVVKYQPVKRHCNIYNLQQSRLHSPVLVSQHSELVYEGLWAAGGDVLAQQLPGHLVVVADDHGDAAGVEPHLAAVERDGACAVRSGHD